MKLLVAFALIALASSQDERNIEKRQSLSSGRYLQGLIDNAVQGGKRGEISVFWGTSEVQGNPWRFEKASALSL